MVGPEGSEEHREGRRAELLNSALACFSEHGYEATVQMPRAYAPSPKRMGAGAESKWAVPSAMERMEDGPMLVNVSFCLLLGAAQNFSGHSANYIKAKSSLVVILKQFSAFRSL